MTDRVAESIEKLHETLDMCRIAGMKTCKLPLTSLYEVFEQIEHLRRENAKLSAPDGLKMDVTFWCKSCGEKAIKCEHCHKWICPDCNAKHGGAEYFCDSCWNELR